MKIVIIGSGNVAYHLAKAFVENKIQVTQVFGRNEAALKEISDELGIPYSVNQLENADLYLIAVSDSSITEVSKLIQNENALVAHTSGSTSIQDLDGLFRKAVFYPLQTFSKTKNIVYSEIPFFIDAEKTSDLEILKTLATKISDKVLEADDEKRKYIHLTAVFACNFVNHLFAKASEISESENIPFEYFFPLIEETTQKIHDLSPKLAQTGPAVRNDKRVLELHQSLLKDEEALKIYKTMNESIQKMYNLD